MDNPHPPLEHRRVVVRRQQLKRLENCTQRDDRSLAMKSHLLITTIAAVVLVGCGKSQSPEPPTAEAPDISIHFAAWDGNIEAVKQLLTDHS